CTFLVCRRLPVCVTLEPCIAVEPRLRRVDGAVALERNLRLVLRDVLQVAVEEEVAPIAEQGAGLVFERRGGPPPAEDRREDPAVREPPLRGAERPFVDHSPAEPPRTAGVARLPERRLPIDLVDNPV